MNVLRRTAIIVAAIAGLFLTTGWTAQAAPTAYQCDAAHDHDGVLVAFADVDYGGECRAWSNPDTGNLQWVNYNDTISSLKNRTPYTLCFYSDADYSGAVFQIHGYEWWYNIPSWIDNQISSFGYC